MLRGSTKKGSQEPPNMIGNLLNLVRKVLPTNIGNMAFCTNELSNADLGRRCIDNGYQICDIGKKTHKFKLAHAPTTKRSHFSTLQGSGSWGSMRAELETMDREHAFASLLIVGGGGLADRAEPGGNDAERVVPLLGRGVRFGVLPLLGRGVRLGVLPGLGRGVQLRVPP